MYLRFVMALACSSLLACGATTSSSGAHTTNQSTTRGAAPSACPADDLPAHPAPQDFVLRDHECGAGGPACARACEGGDREACLAHAYAFERAGPDPERTRPWYERACRLGSLNGCTNWGAGMSQPGAQPAELACAARVFERTCAGHDPWGCGTWGTALLTGRGTEPDRARAIAVLEGSCREAGHFPCVVLAMAVEEQDPATAARLLERACATGYSDACESALPDR